MTKPTKDQLANLIDPLLKLYLDAAIEEACRPLVAQLEAMITERKTWITDAKRRMDQLEAEQQALWTRYREDDKFALTKPKIIRLCKELKIE
jgi:type VI protein secretion system component VasK